MVLGGDGISQIIYFLLFFVFIFVYPKLMLSQMIARIQKEVVDLQKLTDDSIQKAAKAMGGSVAENKKKLNRMIEFFAVAPESTDPSGLIPKFDKTMTEIKASFRRFAKENTSIKDESALMNVETVVSHAAGNHQITKIVNHFLGIVKKYKNLQIAMIINMQIPMIREYAKSINRSVQTTIDRCPWGDGVGPLVAAELAGNSKVNKIKDAEMTYSTTTINGRKCIITKALGPGSTVGRPGEGIKQLVKKYKPVKIISIDAAGKMEGERTGSVAEGVGMVMGPPQGPQVDRHYIEDVAFKNKIPMDGIAVKMGMEEAITWMTSDIQKAVPKAIEYVKDHIETVPKNKTVLIIGVGNTLGVGNNKKELKDTYATLKKHGKTLEKVREGEESKGWFGKKPKAPINPQ